MIDILKMTTEEYKNILIDYFFYTSNLGEILIATTNRGVCFLGFVDDRNLALEDMKSRFPKGKFLEQGSEFQKRALSLLLGAEQHADLPLHLYGTDFQMNVWAALIKIDIGETTTYGDLADGIGSPGASRAVGSAVGKNPVSVLIPCHRVIRSSGELGGYHWGLERKKSLLKSEGIK